MGLMLVYIYYVFSILINIFIGYKSLMKILVIVE
jgi:hypothetical protein